MKLQCIENNAYFSKDYFLWNVGGSEKKEARNENCVKLKNYLRMPLTMEHSPPPPPPLRAEAFAEERWSWAGRGEEETSLSDWRRRSEEAWDSVDSIRSRFLIVPTPSPSPSPSFSLRTSAQQQHVIIEILILQTKI